MELCNGTGRRVGLSTQVTKPAVYAFAILFVIGAVGGLVELISDTDDTSTGAGVATANWVHVILAAVGFAVAVVAWRRDRRRLVDLLTSPLSADGWNQLVDATLALPVALTEVALLLVRRVPSVVRIEAWRAHRLPDRAHTGDNDSSLARPRPWRFVVGGLLSSALVGVAVVVVWYVPLRAGEQLFAALDPDFTRDAWGGPSYLGASTTHWFDLALLLYTSATVIAVATRRRQGRRLDLLASYLGVVVGNGRSESAGDLLV